MICFVRLKWGDWAYKYQVHIHLLDKDTVPVVLPLYTNKVDFK